MVATKIQDEGEVLRWFEKGWTYQQMREKYREKYGIETSLSLWSSFRKRHGLPRRIERNEDMIPWAVKPEHRHRHAAAMLRTANRLNKSLPVGESALRAYRTWIVSLEEQDAVVHYDPDTEEGFFYVPRRPNIDKGLIREPERKTTLRKNAEPM